MSKRQRLHISHLPDAEKISGLHFTAKEHRLMIDGVNDQLAAYEKLRAIPIDNGTSPALVLRSAFAGHDV